MSGPFGEGQKWPFAANHSKNRADATEERKILEKEGAARAEESKLTADHLKSLPLL